MSRHPNDLLSGYVDGELDAASRLRVATHLLECGACARVVEELRAVDGAAALLEVDPPDGYFDDFGARVRSRLDARRPRVIPWWWTAAAAALLVGVVTPIVLRQPAQQALPVPMATTAAPATHPAPMAEAPAEAAAPPVAKAPAKLDQPAAAPVTRKPEPTGQKEKDELRPQDLAREATVSERDDKVARARTPGAPGAPPPAAAAAAPEGFAAAPLEDAEERQAGRLRAEPKTLQPTKSEDARGGAGRVPAPPPPAPVPQAPATASNRDGDSAAVSGFAGLAKKQGETEDKARFGELAARQPASADEARALREAWRAFARRYPASPLADEARVRVIASSADAYQRSGDKRDLALLHRDASAYLERNDAAQADRVRALLANLD